MKSWLNYLTLTVLLFLLPLPVMAQELDTILEANAKAQGGTSNWAKIENVRMVLQMKEPSSEVTGNYVATRDGNVRMDYMIGGKMRIYSEGLHDNKAWSWSKLYGVETRSAEDAAMLRHEIDMPGRFFTLKDLADRGADVTLQGVADDGGRQQWQVRVTLPDGFSRDFFIDQETHLVVRERDHRLFHPNEDDEEGMVETTYRDERWVDGVLRYDRSDQTNAETGEWLNTTTVTAIEHNVEISDDFFQPED